MGTLRFEIVLLAAWGGVAGLVGAAEPVSPPNSASAPAVVTASADNSQPAPQALSEQLADEIRSLLGQTKATVLPTDRTKVGRAIELYRQLNADRQMPVRERTALGGALRTRLHGWQRLLAVRLPPSKDRPVLAQQLPGAAGAQAAGPIAQQPPANHSRELIEVIEATIAPSSWESRGGRGTIAFWSLGHGLVVRQTGEVHEQLGDLLGDLR